MLAVTFERPPRTYDIHLLQLLVLKGINYRVSGTKGSHRTPIGLVALTLGKPLIPVRFYLNLGHFSKLVALS